jgi:hypothetical protein
VERIISLNSIGLSGTLGFISIMETFAVWIILPDNSAKETMSPLFNSCIVSNTVCPAKHPLNLGD